METKEKEKLTDKEKLIQLPFKLGEHQKRILQFGAGKNAVLVDAFCGSGKTSVGLCMSILWKAKSVLIVVPAFLIPSWKQTIKDFKFKIPCDVVSYGKVKHFKRKVDVVVLDECFHPDSLINTEKGLVKICELSENTRVFCLDEKTGKILLDHPKKIWKNGTKNVTFIKTNKGELKCTPTHKILSEGQWTQAKDLKVGQRITYAPLQRSFMKKLLSASVAVGRKLTQTMVTSWTIYKE